MIDSESAFSSEYFLQITIRRFEAEYTSDAAPTAQVAFDCIALGNIDRAHTNALTARAAVDAAETTLRAALSGAGLVVDTGADGADVADEAVDAQPDEAFEAFGPGTDEVFDDAGASDVRLPANEVAGR